jgi:hypothetical protein
MMTVFRFQAFLSPAAGTAASFDLTHDEIVLIPAAGQPKRSRPFRVPRR